MALRGLTIGVFLAALTAASVHAAGTLPNIVFIHTDDHGWADVSYRGSIIDTPNIDSIAAAGVTLERYHTQPICSPTRVGLMTGRNPLRMGITGNFNEGEDGVPLDEHFLPETLKVYGYQTWALGKWHLGGTTGPQYLPQGRGFDHFYGFVGGSINESTHETPGTGQLDWQRNGTPIVEAGLSTDLLGTEAVSLIQQRDTNRPFFLYLAFHALHTPYDAPQDLKDKYAALGLTGQQLEYSAMAENMDRNIGLVLATLASEGIESTTLVIFASDNGADEGKGGSNLPLRGWKGQIFEGGNRTPAAMRWTGVIPAGTTSTQFVSHQDWLPTLAAAAGIVPHNSKPLDGRDRWRVILNGESGFPQGYVVKRGQGTSVLDGTWKLLRETNASPFQLYDVYADPFETTDLAGANPSAVSDMARYIDLIATDTDIDFVADDEDLCTTSAVRWPTLAPAQQRPAKLRLQLKNLHRGAGLHGLLAKGYFNPATTTSPAISPSANGVHVHVADAAGEIYDISIPGGLTGSSPCDPRDGWTMRVSGTKTKWTYLNKSNGLPNGGGGCTAGAAAGITKIIVYDQTTTSRQAFQFQVMVRNASFTTIPALPLSRLQLDLTLAEDDGSGVASEQAQAGQCAEFLIEGSPVSSQSPKPYCKTSLSDAQLARVTCSGP